MALDEWHRQQANSFGAVADVYERGRPSYPAEAIDWFVPHQANQYMLDHLRDKMGLPKEKFFVGMRECGNTVSASIPIALADAAQQGLLRPSSLLALVGFGVGYSWAACLARWR